MMSAKNTFTASPRPSILQQRSRSHTVRINDNQEFADNPDKLVSSDTTKAIHKQGSFVKNSDVLIIVGKSSSTKVPQFSQSTEAAELKRRSLISLRDEKYPGDFVAGKITDPKHVKRYMEEIIKDPKISEDKLKNLTSQYLQQMGAFLSATSVIERKSSSSFEGSHALDVCIAESDHSLKGSIKSLMAITKKGVHKRRPVSYPELPLTVPSHVVRKPLLPKRVGEEMRENLTSLLRSRLARRKREEFLADQKNFYSLEMEKQLEGMNQSKLDRRQLLEQRLLADMIKARIDWHSSGLEELRAKVRIVVVGAGLAGLSAAAELLREGFTDVTILEASDRVGGRLHSVCLQDNNGDHNEGAFFDQNAMDILYAELGSPGWINEDITHSVFSLARDRELIDWTRELKRPQCHIMTADGRQLHKSFVSSAIRFCAYTEKDTQILTSQHRGRSSLSYSDYLRVRRAHLMAGVNEAEKNALASAVDSIATVWRFASGDSNGDMAADLKGQLPVGQDHISIAHDIEIPSEETSPSLNSLRKFTCGLQFEDRRQFRRFSLGSTSNLCSSLMQKFQSDMVRYRQRVCRIDWSEFSNKVERNGLVPKIKIISDNGKVYHAHHVIMAVPLGHLKKFAREMFEPSLPQSKLDTIDKMGVGTVSRIILYYRYPSWPAPFHLIWPGRKSEGADSLSSRCFQLLTSPGTLHILELTLLDNIPAKAADNDAHVAHEVSSILEKFLSVQYSSRKFGKSVPPPDKIVRSSWRKDPLYLGSHPYLRRGCDSGDLARLASPVNFRNRPVIQFAGDYTWSDLSRLTHAARSSGLKEAKRLTNFYDDYFGYENTNPTPSDNITQIF